MFASHKLEREKAFKILERDGLPVMPEPLESLLSGLRLLKGEQEMSLELTPEQVQEMGREWGKRYLSTLPPQERLVGTTPIDVINYFKPVEILANLNPVDRLAGLSVDDIEDYLKKLKQNKH